MTRAAIAAAAPRCSYKALESRVRQAPVAFPLDPVQDQVVDVELGVASRLVCWP
jgi:hypothetical protein